MGQDNGPLVSTERRRLAAMSIGELGSLLDVLDQIDPRSRKALIRLRLGAAFNQSFHHSSSGDLFATTIKNLLLKLCDQGISLDTEFDG